MGQDQTAQMASGIGSHIKFSDDKEFQLDLRRRVEAFFADSGLHQRDCAAMYAKTATVLAVFAISYALLVFVADAWWQVLPLAVLLGFMVAEIGFNIMHDASHRAYSDRQWVNQLMAMTLDLVGGSSYMWRWKHVVFHHTYVNLKGRDTDIDLGIFGRVSPHHQRRGFHRWQHWYLWPLYGFLTPKWHFYDDFRDYVLGKMGDNSFPRPRGRELAVFIGGKLVFLGLAFGLPLLFHPFWIVLSVYALSVGVAGVVLSVVFQLAHCVEEADFPELPADATHVHKAWAIHQVETTVDFARDDKLVSWLLGGLNFQVAHHLFPRVSHVHYPALSRLVEQACREHGVRYACNASLGAGLASHFRWLRLMGMPHEA
jgi:linoleoyl-CoA desaturase